jgi:hypothetical protein
VAFASATMGEPTQLEGVAVGGEKLDSEQGRKVILSLGKKVLSSGSLISTAVNFFTFGLGGKAAETAAATAAEMIKTERTGGAKVPQHPSGFMHAHIGMWLSTSLQPIKIGVPGERPGVVARRPRCRNAERAP